MKILNLESKPLASSDLCDAGLSALAGRRLEMTAQMRCVIPIYRTVMHRLSPVTSAELLYIQYRILLAWHFYQ